MFFIKIKSHHFSPCLSLLESHYNSLLNLPTNPKVQVYKHFYFTNWRASKLLRLIRSYTLEKNVLLPLCQNRIISYYILNHIFSLEKCSYNPLRKKLMFIANIDHNRKPQVYTVERWVAHGESRHKDWTSITVPACMTQKCHISGYEDQNNRKLLWKSYIWKFFIHIYCPFSFRCLTSWCLVYWIIHVL